MNHQLTIITGSDSGHRFKLIEGQSLVIGRGGTSDTQIDDPHVSRVHCEVRFDRDRVIVRDLGSSSGTIVESRTIREVELRFGDVIQVGRTRIRYELEASD